MSLNGLDVAALLLIIGSGVLEFVFAQRGAAFYGGDTTYLELARSIVQRHSYGFNFTPETMIPPGFPAILAIFYPVLGWNHEILVRLVAVLGTLGLIVSYELIRREEGRLAATVICLLFAASPALFAFATRSVFSDLPYLFTSMLTLTMATRLDRSNRRNGMVLLLCAGAMVASVLIRSAGITLSAGLLAWFSVSLLVNRPTGIERLKKFRLVLVAGLLAQALWMVWIHEKRPEPEWQLGGYPQHYLAQLTIKNGNEPELGFATAGDVVRRFGGNLTVRAAHVVSLATGKYFTSDWFAPWVLVPLALIVIGLCRSIVPTGGQLYDWYFVGHETMYLFWPWNFETRFLLPVMPLACLYAWRGGRVVAKWAEQRPRLFAGCTLIVAIFSAMYGFVGGSVSDHLRILSMPVQIAAAAGWVLVVCAVACVGYASTRLLAGPFGWRRHSFGAVRIAAGVFIAALASAGFSREFRLGHENLQFDQTRDRDYPEIGAAQWLRLQTPTSAVIMARQMDVVSHYAERKVVWFPPISDPDVLMQGILAHHVQFVLIYDRGASSYWRPAELECFTHLSLAYPHAFRLVQQGPSEEIFAVLPTAATHHGT